MRHTILRAIMVAGLAIPACTGVVALAQDGGAPPQQQGGRGGRGGFGGGGMGVSGEVTANAGGSLTVKGEDGVTYTVTGTDSTRVMKAGMQGGGMQGATEKVADIKVGDGVTARGTVDAANKTVSAMMLMVVDAAQIKAAKDNLGKTYVVGKVTAIDVDNAKLTLELPDKSALTIGFDDSSSFKRGRVQTGLMAMVAASGGMMMGGGRGGNGGGAAPEGESITLADIKVGDMVSGKGVVKSGSFVPSVLTVGEPGMGGPGGGQRRGGGGAGAPPTPPAPPAPATPPSN